jgi:PTH1 family peptidyl-tRNA hydrolase
MILRALGNRFSRPRTRPEWLIVGLGNPGALYATTRHNAGFMCVDRLARRHELRFNDKRAQAVVARGPIGDVEVALAKPQTYMNLSGQSVRQLASAWGMRPASIVVVYDEVDLPLGTMRVRSGGGPGTHNGMRSVVAELGSSAFARVRIGIGADISTGKSLGNLADYVLDTPDDADYAILGDVLERACDAIEAITAKGIEFAMNRFNG